MLCATRLHYCVMINIGAGDQLTNSGKVDSGSSHIVEIISALKELVGLLTSFISLILVRVLYVVNRYVHRLHNKINPHNESD